MKPFHAAALVLVVSCIGAKCSSSGDVTKLAPLEQRPAFLVSCDSRMFAGCEREADKRCTHGVYRAFLCDSDSHSADVLVTCALPNEARKEQGLPPGWRTHTAPTCDESGYRAARRAEGAP